MPNFADNVVYVRHDDKSKIDLIETELVKYQERYAAHPERCCSSLFATICPEPEMEASKRRDWRATNWGALRYAVDIYNWKRTDDNSIALSFMTAWHPPFGLYGNMARSGYRVRAYWCELNTSQYGRFDSDANVIEEYGDYLYDDPNRIPPEIDKAIASIRKGF